MVARFKVSSIAFFLSCYFAQKTLFHDHFLLFNLFFVAFSTVCFLFCFIYPDIAIYVNACILKNVQRNRTMKMRNIVQLYRCFSALV